MASVDVVTIENKRAGRVELDPVVFEAAVKGHLLHAEVRRQLAHRRAGTHSSKNRSAVSGIGTSERLISFGTLRSRLTTLSRRYPGTSHSKRALDAASSIASGSRTVTPSSAVVGSKRYSSGNRLPPTSSQSG